MRETEQQSTLSKKNKLRNVKNAFVVTHQMGTEHVAIIDDVITSGRTVYELAGALKSIGVKQVGV